METETRETNERADSCPKKPWVMTVLSDDEALAESGGVPPAVRLHLSSCDSCRQLAGRLLHVGDLLGRMAAMSPAPALVAGADAQLARALRDDCALTGRVDLPEEPAPARSVAPFSHFVLRYAAVGVAAVIALAATVQWIRTPSVPNAARRSEDAGVAGAPWRLPDPADVGPDIPPPYLARSPLDPLPDNSQDAVEHRLAGERCYHATAAEAAECERIHGFHQAMGLPFRGQPERKPSEGIDTPHHAVSTPKRPNQP